MAIPLSADSLILALRAEGVRVSEYSGWRTHNRNSRGPWGPVNGVVIHHTAGRDSLNVVWNGTDDLAGPLCHTHLAKNATATMIANGRANHAGTFASNAHDAVVGESAVHPRPDREEPVDGNAHYYGIDDDEFGVILGAYLAQHGARRGRVGGADAELIDGSELVAFAVDWIATHAAPGRSPSA